MKKLLLDFETQAVLPISNPAYTSDEGTKILCMSWGFLGEAKGPLWWPGDPVPQEITDHVNAGGMLGASNARFDREIWEYVAVNDHDFPVTKLEQWYCTQAQARVAGLPSALDKSARALGLKVRKSANGTRLINACCVPPFSTDPQDYADLGAYCDQDWVVMDKVARSIPQLSDINLEDYQFNELVNDRGIKIDRAMALAATKYADVERAEINEKLDDITCGEITKCTQHVRVAKWIKACLEEDGLPEVVKLMVRHKTDKVTKVTKKKYSSDKTVRANMLAGHDEHIFSLPEDVHELLKLMYDAGGSAVSKFSRMAQKASLEDDRVRGVLRYAGAPSTQRYSSMGLQIHNFRRDVINTKDDGFEPQFVIDQMLKGEELKDLEGKPLRIMDTLGRLLRSAIIPAKGKKFVVGDWNAIESRMTAYLSGETDKLAMLMRGDCPYCYAASGIYGRKINKIDDPKERQIGKVVDLACGFLGGEGALLSMSAQFGVYVDPEHAKGIVMGYRATHEKIISYGDALLRAAQRAVRFPNTRQDVRHVWYYFDSSDGALYGHLPDNETVLRYPECRFEMKSVPWDENVKKPQLTALKASFTPGVDATEWSRHGLWRGIFLENVVQATCCAAMRECLLQCEDAGLAVAFHVHDEIVLEVDDAMAPQALEKLQSIMETPLSWLEGLPLVAEPEIMTRYGK